MLKKCITFVFVFLLLGITILMIIARKHYLLGSGLNLVRVPLLIATAVLFILCCRFKSRGIAAYSFLFMFALLSIEGLWNIGHEYRLKVNPLNVVHKEISVLSYNLYFRNQKPGEIINQINRFQPDIVAFQEVTPYWDRLLQTSLHYPYKISKPLKGTHGLAIYSKYPVSNIRYINNQSGRPVAQFCRININNKSVAFSNVHLASPAGSVQSVDHFKKYYEKNYYRRIKQFREVHAFFDRYYPACPSRVLLGDLNTMRIDPLYNSITKEWFDCYKKTGKGQGASFPNSRHTPWPVITLDYIFIRGDLIPLHSQMITGSSDHLGIMSRISL